jgi:hypothetical protein
VLVGTTSSTFSFSAHARGLAVPYYPSFRSDSSDCHWDGRGILFRVHGETFDQCTRLVTRDWECGQVHCESLNKNCVQFVIDGVHTEFVTDNCIEDVCGCMNFEVLSDFLLDIDHRRRFIGISQRAGIPDVASISFGK